MRSRESVFEVDEFRRCQDSLHDVTSSRTQKVHLSENEGHARSNPSRSSSVSEMTNSGGGPIPPFGVKGCRFPVDGEYVA